MVDIDFEIVRSRFHVTLPADPAFTEIAVKELGGRWRPRSGLWSFPKYRARQVLITLKRLYGAEALGRWNRD